MNIAERLSFFVLIPRFLYVYMGMVPVFVLVGASSENFTIFFKGYYSKITSGVILHNTFSGVFTGPENDFLYSMPFLS